MENSESAAEQLDIIGVIFSALADCDSKVKSAR